MTNNNSHHHHNNNIFITIHKIPSNNGKQNLTDFRSFAFAELFGSRAVEKVGQKKRIVETDCHCDGGVATL